jgi:hypothetical protein
MSTAQVAYRAYTVIKREGQDDFWLPIGAAFMHQDGDGYNIVLQALPIDGKIVLRLPKDDQNEGTEAQQAAVYAENDRRKSGREKAGVK